MANSSNEHRDHRKNISMEDSAMTIEFLRVRLLSERSVSRTARQRADELAKRVVELEEQLKIVTLQRKKAEKATADILAILENHGMSDISEPFDSSSDQETTLIEPKVVNDSVEETSVNVKGRRNKTEAFSGSEFDSSPLSGRSLSWKSGKGSPQSLEKKKYTDSTRRRRSSISSTGSSSPKRAGKSCRQRRSETRLSVEELQHESSTLAVHSNGLATHSQGFTNCSDLEPHTSREGSENHEERDLHDGSVSGALENQRGSNGRYFNGHGVDKDMERALEHQAQLIGRYEAEEKAQREWEEKFTENNSCALDSCDPGNHSDVTDEKDDMKAPAPTCSAGTIGLQNQQAKLEASCDPGNHSDVTDEKDDMKAPAPTCSAGTIGLQNQQAKLEAVDVGFSKESKTNCFQSPPHLDMGGLQDQKCSSVIANESPGSDFAFPMTKGEFLENHHSSPLHSFHRPPPSHGTLHNHSAVVSSSSCSYPGGSLSTAEASKSRNELALIPNETSDKLGSVLEALQQAKLSLKREINSLPLVEGGSVGKAIEASIPGRISGDRLEIPVGFSGLFRLPNDFRSQATNQANSPGVGSQLSLSNYSHETAGNKFLSSPFLDSRSRASFDDRFLSIPTAPYSEIRSRVPTWAPLHSFDPHLDVSLLSSSGNIHLSSNSSTDLPSYSRFAYPTYPTYPMYTDSMPQMLSSEGLSRPLPSRVVGIPPATHFPFQGDGTRPHMYNR